MIVREIVADPDGVLKTFDYFNDYKDTHRWLVCGAGNDAVLKRLEAGHQAWMQEYNRRLQEGVR